MMSCGIDPATPYWRFSKAYSPKARSGLGIDADDALDISQHTDV
jgi:hypothetical protein